MVTIKQLKKQKAVLQAREEARKERVRLMQEIKALRNPRTVAFKQNLKRGLVTGGRGVLDYLDKVTRPVPVRAPVRRKPVKRRKR